MGDARKRGAESVAGVASEAGSGRGAGRILALKWRGTGTSLVLRWCCMDTVLAPCPLRTISRPDLGDRTVPVHEQLG